MKLSSIGMSATQRSACRSDPLGSLSDQGTRLNGMKRVDPGGHGGRGGRGMCRMIPRSEASRITIGVDRMS